MIINSVDFFKNNQTTAIPEDCKIILAVWKIKNPENIGQIIRLAHNISAEKVFFISGKENYRESKIKKTAGFSYEQMPWQFLKESEFLAFCKNEYKLVALETCESSKNIYQTKLPKKIILLAGSESHGIPAEIIEKSNLQIHVPMPGGCKSMNISHAISVAAFEWYRQVILK